MRAERTITWVFVGKDTEGIPRFASQRGTLDKYGKPLKEMLRGMTKLMGLIW